jgi:hypothetical protein
MYVSHLLPITCGTAATCISRQGKLSARGTVRLHDGGAAHAAGTQMQLPLTLPQVKQRTGMIIAELLL